ncbi:hypothetical protein BDV38DRAFT_199654 [Aspergillus pseudotamarii]|uniref:Secreted protein n=1 Tax=Aspergillus pseudotamarii TaxID=132259 RepID=A0A5N6SI49_ASPPS|nr:uncharacterized protein BDV38DRAFT_199654 [Aspergillus pseudotamarii]KAE8132784.1 hypothetical protein BDV38DRAFT_199654 [Aspergillus pseudotamarii]
MRNGRASTSVFCSYLDLGLYVFSASGCCTHSEYKCFIKMVCKLFDDRAPSAGSRRLKRQSGACRAIGKSRASLSCSICKTPAIQPTVSSHHRRRMICLPGRAAPIPPFSTWDN